MKVLILAGYADSLVNFRGSLIAALAASGHGVIGAAPGIDAALAQRLEALGARAVSVEYTRPNKISRTVRSTIRVRCYTSGDGYPRHQDEAAQLCELHGRR